MPQLHKHFYVSYNPFWTHHSSPTETKQIIKFMKRLIVILGSIIIIIVAVYSVQNFRYEATRVEVDALYTYFHKIQDSIKKKNYPINMDSLKREVHDSMMTLKIWGKLNNLEKSVSAYNCLSRNN